jgi:hypothetical protein
MLSTRLARQLQGPMRQAAAAARPVALPSASVRSRAVFTQVLNMAKGFGFGNILKGPKML